MNKEYSKSSLFGVYVHCTLPLSKTWKTCVLVKHPKKDACRACQVI